MARKNDKRRTGQDSDDPREDKRLRLSIGDRDLSYLPLFSDRSTPEESKWEKYDDFNA